MRYNVLLLSAAQLAAAHFGLEVPEWRGDTLSHTGDSGYDQRTLPCAGVPSHAGNVTEWPLTGGSLQLKLTHDWTYVFVNLGFGSNVTNFNVSLTPEFWNVTGEGILCVPRIPIPEGLDIVDGTEASLQVINVGHTGTNLVNCADIRFSSSAKPLEGDACKTTEGISYYVVGETQNPQTSTGEVPQVSSNSGGSNASDGAAGGSSAAPSSMSVNTLALTAVAGLAVAFVSGLAL